MRSNFENIARYGRRIPLRIDVAERRAESLEHGSRTDAFGRNEDDLPCLAGFLTVYEVRDLRINLIERLFEYVIRIGHAVFPTNRFTH